MMAQLHAEEQRFRARLERDVITEETIADVAAYCERVKAKLDTFTLEEKKLALDALNIKVLVNGGSALTIEG